MMFRNRRLGRMTVLGVAVLVGVTAGPASSAQPLDPHYTVTAWGEQNGLSASQVYAIAQGPQDYLWLGTDVGLVRFDGVRFVPWTLVSETTLPTGPILALCAGRDGSLWLGFGSYGGVARSATGRSCSTAWTMAWRPGL